MKPEELERMMATLPEDVWTAALRNAAPHLIALWKAATCETCDYPGYRCRETNGGKQLWCDTCRALKALEEVR